MDLVRLIAAVTAREADAVARALDAERITYQETLDAAEEGGERACYLGTVFLVQPADLERSRALLHLSG